MIDFLSQYGLFLAKSLTFVIGALVIISTIFALSQKDKQNEGTLIITSLNEKYEETREDLQAETLSKPEYKKWVKQLKKQKKQAQKKEAPPLPRLFVLRFDGDIRASHVTELRETISAILEIAFPTDEVLVILESAGGMVHSYGLAASQLDRIRQRQLPLTVAIDKIAASGGYLMAVVADHIIASPFAIVGSIGVVAQIPNFHRFLDKHNVDFEIQTAGEFKRTLTLFGKNTDKGRKKFQEEIEETHTLFKQFITQHRPQVDITAVATGEHWHATQALEFKLLDKIQTSDDFILEKIKTAQVFELSYQIKQKLSERLVSNLFAHLEKHFVKLFHFNPSTER